MLSYWQILNYIWVPVLAMIAGATIASIWRPSASFRGGIQHFAAGVVTLVFTAELFPVMQRSGDVLKVVAGFMAGIICMYLIKWLIHSFEESSSIQSGSLSVVVIIGADLLVDGLLISIGFATDSSTGLLLTIALTLEILFLGIAAAATMKDSARSNLVIISTIILLGLLVIIGSFLGFLILHWGAQALHVFIFSFGAAALLYLITEELLAEAHEGKSSAFLCSLYFLGFISMFVVGQIA